MLATSQPHTRGISVTKMISAATANITERDSGAQNKSLEESP